MIGIEPDEGCGFGDVDFGGGEFLERGEAGLEAVGEDVGHGGEADVGIGLQGLCGGAGAAAAAADEADFEDAVVGRGVFCGVAESGGGDEAANGGGGGVFEEVAA